MITVVDGLEMFAVHHSQGIRCNKCGAGASSAELSLHLHLAGEDTRFPETRKLAAERGWTHPGGDVDHCPKCSAQ